MSPAFWLPQSFQAPTFSISRLFFSLFFTSLFCSLLRFFHSSLPYLASLCLCSFVCFSVQPVPAAHGGALRSCLLGASHACVGGLLPSQTTVLIGRRPPRRPTGLQDGWPPSRTTGLQMLLPWSIYRSIDRSIDLSTYLSFYLSIYLPTYLSIYLPIYLSIFLILSIYLLSILTSVYLNFIYLPMYPCIHLCIDVSTLQSIRSIENLRNIKSHFVEPLHEFNLSGVDRKFQDRITPHVNFFQ